MSAVTRTLTRLWLRLQRPALRRRVRRLILEQIDGVPLVVLPDVFNPVVFRTGAFLARTVAAQSAIRNPQSAIHRALDMGAGSGVGAVFAARAGYRVTAVDINPEAVRCARINMLLNHLDGCIEVRQGDLFAPVAGERFDLVLFNPPFFHGAPKDALDAAWRSMNVMERFATGLGDVLAPGGRALIVLSTDGEPQRMLDALTIGGFKTEPVAQRDFGNEVITVYAAYLRE